MPVTLVQELALHQPKTRKAVIDTLVRESPLASRIPYESIGDIRGTAPYLSSIPSVPFRHINEASTTVSVNYADIPYSLSIFDADIDIDPVIQSISNKIQNTQTTQSQNVVRSMAYQIVNYYVNGDSTSNTREFDGLEKRLNDDVRLNGQTKNATGSTAELNLAVGTASDSTYLQFWHKMLETASLINVAHGLPQDGNATILTNVFAMMVMETSLRQIKQFNTSQDQYNRELMSWKGMQIVDAGWAPAGAVDGSFPAAGSQGDLVIGYDSEAPTATNGANLYNKQTPIYFIRFGQNYNMGVQQAPMKVENLGKIHTSPHYHRTNILWVVNPAVIFQKRTWARLVGCNFSGST